MFYLFIAEMRNEKKQCLLKEHMMPAEEIQEDPRQEVCMNMLDDLAKHLETCRQSSHSRHEMSWPLVISGLKTSHKLYSIDRYIYHES